MVTFLCVAVIVLLCVIYVASGRIITLEDEVEWWRNEAIKLNNHKDKEESLWAESQSSK